jgi:hypothetical protein
VLAVEDGGRVGGIIIVDAKVLGHRRQLACWSHVKECRASAAEREFIPVCAYASNEVLLS